MSTGTDYHLVPPSQAVWTGSRKEKKKSVCHFRIGRAHKTELPCIRSLLGDARTPQQKAVSYKMSVICSKGACTHNENGCPLFRPSLGHDGVEEYSTGSVTSLQKHMPVIRFTSSFSGGVGTPRKPDCPLLLPFQRLGRPHREPTVIYSFPSRGVAVQRINCHLLLPFQRERSNCYLHLHLQGLDVPTEGPLCVPFP